MEQITYSGPDAYTLADWRRRINDLYAEIRKIADPERAWRHWLSERTRLFANHPMSPLTEDQKAGFDQITAYAYDPSLRFLVGLEPTSGESLTFDLGTDGKMTARPAATTDGLEERLGAELTVYWIEGYGGGLFLPFRDATTGSETYGGGRYLIDAIKGSDLGLDHDGRLILDFNFAYNPSCALSDDFVCPLSPAENTLPVPIHAGERVLEFGGTRGRT